MSETAAVVSLPSAFWRVTCHVGQNPGQWPAWYREQCCAVGWRPTEYPLRGDTDDKGWVTARNALQRMKAGDAIVASLPDNRVGRLGTIVGLSIEDAEWNPIVAPSKRHPNGENGRRVLVRWDLTVGPDDMNQVVALPPGARIPPQFLRHTVQTLPVEMYPSIRAAMTDESNWTSLIGRFSMEQALSDYIALHPGRLEGGMILHTSLAAREYAFDDRTRADVLLEDRYRRTVVVECKQGHPTPADIAQVSSYRDRLRKAEPGMGELRALLVHGGSSRISPDLAAKAAHAGVELVYHELSVSFVNSRA
jgi:hypothetical protein